MCDWNGEEIKYTAGTPKDVAGLRNRIIGGLNTGLQTGATNYPFPLPGSASMDPQQMQSRNLISALMGQSYNPTASRYTYSNAGQQSPFQSAGMMDEGSKIGLFPGGRKSTNWQEWVRQKRNPLKKDNTQK